MEMQNLKYRIFIVNNSYAIKYPESYIQNLQTTNGISGQLAPGSFLMKIHNMNFTDIRDAVFFLKDCLDDPETTDINDSFANFRDTIASWFMDTTDFDYCIASKDIELLSDLIACQFFDNYMASGNTDSFSSICNAIYQIQAMCFQLMEYREYTPDICNLIEEQQLSLSYRVVSGSPIRFYAIRTLRELFVMDAVLFMESKEKLCRCKFCNKYFFKQKDTKVYCPYPNPHNPYNGMTCKDYHAQNPSYTDEISGLSKKAYKAQYKYLAEHDKLASNILPNWTDELKKRERIARDNWSSKELETFIENTRFSKIGFDVNDYSIY